MKHLDRERFTELYEATFTRVYNYICYRINNHNDAEDLVSTVYARAIEKFDSLDPKRGTAEAWLFGIARNALIDYYRTKGKRIEVDVEAFAETLPSEGRLPDEIAVKREDNRELIQALDTLNERERHIIALKYAAEMNNREISKFTSLSESNVGVILFRGLRKLKQILYKEGQPCANNTMLVGRKD